jgi:hypothetical protein
VKFVVSFVVNFYFISLEKLTTISISAKTNKFEKFNYTLTRKKTKTSVSEALHNLVVNFVVNFYFIPGRNSPQNTIQGKQSLIKLLLKENSNFSFKSFKQSYGEFCGEFLFYFIEKLTTKHNPRKT